jgi:hypothetical protein
MREPARRRFRPEILWYAGRDRTATFFATTRLLLGHQLQACTFDLVRSPSCVALFHRNLPQPLNHLLHASSAQPVSVFLHLLYLAAQHTLQWLGWFVGHDGKY